ncbi:MAG TPA: hypothetical protein VFN35_02635 [Ktedonobacteraceae bacterium]|nr:hypothetical protein [Ktedonobacteraceae bacterium]
MRKSVSRTLFLLAILLEIAGGVVFALGLQGTTYTTSGNTITSVNLGSSSPLLLVSTALFAIGGLLALIAWVGALVRTAQLGRWGWFVCLLLFNGITMLIYIFAGPTTPVVPPSAYGTPMPPRY